MADSCCGTVVDVRRLQTRQRRILYVVLGINAITFAMMLAGSLQGHSTSLLSGGLDNLGDAITYALSIAVVGASAQAKARVALVKGALILGAAMAVGTQIAFRFFHPNTPLFETIGVVGILNLAANLACLGLLSPYRRGDVNMASAWECSRNDVAEGFAVLLAAVGVWVFKSQWPDLLIGAALLLLFLRSAIRIFRNALAELRMAKKNSVTAEVSTTCQDHGCRGETQTK